MFLTEYQVLKLLKVELLHINTLLSCTLWMIVFIAFWVFTLDCCSTSILLANKALVLKPFLFDIFDSFYADYSILFLEIALGHPNCTNIMDPYIMADWYFSWICWLYEVIIVTFLFFFTFFPYNFNNLVLIFFLSFYLFFGNVFLFLLAIWALLWVLIETWIGFFEEIDIDMNGCSFHCSSFDVAKRAWKIDASWSKGQAKIADPALCRHFRKANATLMQTDIAHATKDNKIVFGIITISADLALSILILSLSFIILEIHFTSCYFFAIFLLSVSLHILKILLFFWVKLKDKLKRVFGGNGHEAFFDFW